MLHDAPLAVGTTGSSEVGLTAAVTIHVKLNTRCSVLAAANPLGGEYNRRKTPTAQIGSIITVSV